MHTNKAEALHKDGMLTISAEVKKKLILHAVDRVKMVQQNGHFLTGHRCIDSLPKKIPRIADRDYFSDKHRERMEENST